MLWLYPDNVEKRTGDLTYSVVYQRMTVMKNDVAAEGIAQNTVVLEGIEHDAVAGEGVVDEADGVDV